MVSCCHPSISGCLLLMHAFRFDQNSAQLNSVTERCKLFRYSIGQTTPHHIRHSAILWLEESSASASGTDSGRAEPITIDKLLALFCQLGVDAMAYGRAAAPAGQRITCGRKSSTFFMSTANVLKFANERNATEGIFGI